MDNITTIEALKSESTMIQSFLEITVSEQVEEVLERGNDLSVHIARTGKMLADAKYHLNEKMKSEVFSTLEKTAKQAGATSTAINAIIKSLCRDEQYIVDWVERLNRSATHQLEWCRTMVSKAKADAYLAGGVSGKF